MPWKIIRPMDQKIQLIAEWAQEQSSITDLSTKYGISRKTIYKWCTRYEDKGVDGLKDQSRSPQHSPNKTADAIIKLIIDEKLKNRKRGPKKIYHQYESLNNEPPANHYKKSSRPYVEKIPPIEYDAGYTMRRVRYNGYFRFDGQMYYLTDLLHKHSIALKEFDDGQWKIYYSFLPIGILDVKKKRVLKLN